MNPALPLSTPALIVDLDVFDANVLTMMKLLQGSGKTVRPHVKTHRTSELARRQLNQTAVGVTCATVGEAEAMVVAGIDDVFVANEIVDPAKVARLVALGRRAKVSVAADDPQALEALSREAVRAGVTVSVLVDVDIGLHRCGVTSAAEAVSLAQAIRRTSGLRFAGLMGYEGRLRPNVDNRSARIAHAYGTLANVQKAVVSAGLQVETVSAAGTSTVMEALADRTITEIQAGVYALMEPELLTNDLPFRCGVAIRGTVISRHPGRVILDVGRRSIGMEYGPPVPAGFDAAEVRVNDEHCVLAIADRLPDLGSQLDLIPGQIRTTFNLHDRVWVSRRGKVVDCWPVTARGGSQ